MCHPVNTWEGLWDSRQTRADFSRSSEILLLHGIFVFWFFFLIKCIIFLVCFWLLFETQQESKVPFPLQDCQSVSGACLSLSHPALKKGGVSQHVAGTIMLCETWASYVLRVGTEVGFHKVFCPSSRINLVWLLKEDYGLKIHICLNCASLKLLLKMNGLQAER